MKLLDLNLLAYIIGLIVFMECFMQGEYTHGVIILGMAILNASCWAHKILTSPLKQLK